MSLSVLTHRSILMEKRESYGPVKVPDSHCFIPTAQAFTFALEVSAVSLKPQQGEDQGQGRMDTVSSWIVSDTVVGNWIIALAVFVTVSVVVIYVVAFLQGRALSFWPPRIGEHPGARGAERETSQDLSATEAAGATSDVVPSAAVFSPASDSSMASVALNDEPIALVRVVSGPLLGRNIIIGSGRRSITVGADLTCDVAIPVDELLSGHHFRIRIGPVAAVKSQERRYSFEVIDSGSRNGTFLDGRMVSEPQPISNGGVIQAGGSKFEVFIWK